MQKVASASAVVFAIIGFSLAACSTATEEPSASNEAALAADDEACVEDPVEVDAAPPYEIAPASLEPLTDTTKKCAPKGCCVVTKTTGTCLIGYDPHHNLFCGGAGTSKTDWGQSHDSTQAACPTQATSGGAAANLQSICATNHLAVGAACSEKSGQNWIPTSCAEARAADLQSTCYDGYLKCLKPFGDAYDACYAACQNDPDPGWFIKRYTPDQCVSRNCKPARDAGTAKCDAERAACLHPVVTTP